VGGNPFHTVRVSTFAKNLRFLEYVRSVRLARLATHRRVLGLLSGNGTPLISTRHTQVTFEGIFSMYLIVCGISSISCSNTIVFGCDLIYWFGHTVRHTRVSLTSGLQRTYTCVNPRVNFLDVRLSALVTDKLRGRTVQFPAFVYYTCS